MMNHPLVLAQARAAAERLVAMNVASDAEGIDLAFRQTVGRIPGTAEVAVAQQVLSPANGNPDRRLRAYTDLFHLLFMSLDFRYRDLSAPPVDGGDRG